MAAMNGGGISLVQHRDSILQVCEVLSEQEHLKVTIRESAKGAFCAGFGALAGGLLGGPVGLAVGGTVGSIAAALRSPNFKPVAIIIRDDLTAAQKNRLAEAVQGVLSNIRPEEYVGLLSIVLTSATVKEAVIKEIGLFLLRELNYRMIQ